MAAAAEESTAFAAVGGARRTGASSPESHRLKVRLPPVLTFPACDFASPSFMLNFRSSFLEIPVDSWCFGVPVGGGVACLPSRAALRSFVAAAAAVMPVWAKSVPVPVPQPNPLFALRLSGRFFQMIDMICLEMLWPSV